MASCDNGHMTTSYLPLGFSTSWNSGPLDLNVTLDAYDSYLWSSQYPIDNAFESRKINA
jgi:hypothetical protein